MTDKLPTPDQIETGMIQKELASQKQEANPLDTHAQLFFLYNPRFQSQLQFMSNKQLLNLAQSLTGSEHNKIEDVGYISTLGKTINKKGLIRTIGAVIEHPLSDTLVKLMNKKEQTLFHLIDELLINKYMTCIQKGMEKRHAGDESIKLIEDVIIHTLNMKEFNGRSQVEKDAFATGNKLLCSKFLMMLVTYLEEQKRIEAIEKEKESESVTNESNG